MVSRQKQFSPLLVLAVSFCLLAATWPLAALDEGAPVASLTSAVTPDVLNAKIKEVESAAALNEETKARLVELYRKAISNQEAATANAARAAAFEQATRTAPAQTELVRDEIETAGRIDPKAALNLELESSLEQIERQLKKEQAELAEADASRADFSRRLTDEQARPALIRQRLTEAAQQQQETAAALQVPPEPEASPTLNEAGRWVLETRYTALSAEIRMLDQELLSHPLRVELLQAELDKAAGDVDRIGARVQQLQDLVNRKRQLEAIQVKLAAEEARREIEGLDPVLVRVAEQNTELSDELKTMTSRLNILDQEQSQAEGLVQRFDADFKDAQATLETVGRSESLGPLLLKQRESLPDTQDYVRRTRARAQEIAEVGGRRLLHQEEARRIANVEQTVTELETEVVSNKTPQLRDTLRELVEQRQTLLQKALGEDEFYLRKLRELDTAEHELVDVVRDYDEFLNEQLWWLRVAEPISLSELGNLPGEVEQLLLPEIWSAFFRVCYERVLPAPIFWLAVIAALGVLLKRRALITAIDGTSKWLGKPTTDRFSYTLQALVLTLSVAAPLPLVLAAVGWLLHASSHVTELAQSLGYSLVRIAILLYILRALRMMCLPNGLAAAHFRWPKATVELLRAELGRMTWILVPATLITRFSLDLNPVEAGGVIFRLGFLIFHAALAVALYRLLHARRGMLANWLRVNKASFLVRIYPISFWLLVLVPLRLVWEVFAGYIYSAHGVSTIFLNTLWLFVVLVLLHALARRGLTTASRRLAYKADVEHRESALTARRAEESENGGELDGVLEVEKPEVDITELGDDSQRLATIAIVFAGLVGFYLIWSPLLPALRIFDDVILWYQTVMVDGEAKRLPITLADIGLAVIYALGTTVLAKRLPAVLEFILLQRSAMTEGDRYTAITLTGYVIVGVGILLVLGALGAQWSQLQWLVAALGVGIGFGLQEIVANFISGLIILFERPVRVGDVVTIGNTSGIVTKIRIRATTIRDWDRKELLVPNKDIITGQVLNWSLSDNMTRISIVVGVAYGTDVDKALALMRQAAEEHEQVLNEPAPLLSFDSFGDNALALTLRAYLASIDYRIPTTTELHSTIMRKFEQAGIEIAFPQRDVHLDTREPLRVQIEDTQPKLEGPS